MAVIPVDFTADNNWQITPVGSVQGSPAASSPPQANFVLVDNTLNSGTINITWGPFAFTVPAFTRQKYTLTKGNPAVTLKGTIGQVNVYFLQSDRVPDQVNYFGNVSGTLLKAAFSAYNSTTQSGLGTGSTVVNFDTAQFDTANGFGAIGHLYTLQQSGFASLVILLTLEHATAGTQILTQLFHNGVFEAQAIDYIVSAGNPQTLALLIMDQPNKGDTYTVHVQFNAAGGQVLNGSLFQMFLF